MSMWSHYGEAKQSQLNELRLKTYRVRTEKKKLVEAKGDREKIHELDLELCALEDRRLILKGYQGELAPPLCHKKVSE